MKASTSNFQADCLGLTFLSEVVISHFLLSPAPLFALCIFHPPSVVLCSAFCFHLFPLSHSLPALDCAPAIGAALGVSGSWRRSWFPISVRCLFLLPVMFPLRRGRYYLIAFVQVGLVGPSKRPSRLRAATQCDHSAVCGSRRCFQSDVKSEQVFLLQSET